MNVLCSGTDSDGVVFRYCAGTTPWGNPSEHHDFEPQRHDDGYIEVIGFTMTSLVRNLSLLPGSHGNKADEKGPNFRNAFVCTGHSPGRRSW